MDQDPSLSDSKMDQNQNPGPDRTSLWHQPSQEKPQRTRAKVLVYAASVIALSAIMVYMETRLSFFRKFFPVIDNILYIALANTYFLVILLLAFLAVRIILKTYIEKKRGIWGSGLKTKLTVTIFSVSLISSISLFVLVSSFFYWSMDKWFGDKIEETVESAQVLSQFYYEDLFGRYEKMGRYLSEAINAKNVLDKDKELSAFLKREGRLNFLNYLAVLDLTGQPLMTYSILDDEMTRVLTEKAKGFRKDKGGREIVPLKTADLLMVITPISDEGGRPKALLFIGERIQVPGTQRMKQIDKAYSEFIKDSRPLKKVLKYGMSIPLLLVTVLSIFVSTWFGMKMATAITVPLERVKEGAAIIAQGRFDINLEDRGSDEIGTLVSAFNSMARELKIAKDEIEEKGRYMEVILDNVATGIISTDPRGNVLLLNRAAKEILRIKIDEWVGVPLRALIGPDFRNVVRPFLKEIRAERAGGSTNEMTISLQNDTLYLRTSLTVLRDDTGAILGYVGTFDDITHIMRAEKLATWREIAKRITHEIKNPLTPIRLSAERIRRRLLPGTEGKEKQVLDETTTVILNASDDITAMVNELNKLTETSALRSPGDLNGVIEETMAIYSGLFPNIKFETRMGRLPLVTMDRDKIKRALMNLVSNSITAIDTAEGEITATTRYDGAKGVIWVELADTGPGIKDEDKARVFDPYFSRNPQGTGLGLAIVNSVILEHGGRINVEDNKPQGAKMVIELPVLET
jgi:two-component system, NtrC family, nitrogen regulation sensor histidine kinase NtrY